MTDDTLKRATQLKRHIEELTRVLDGPYTLSELVGHLSEDSSARLKETVQEELEGRLTALQAEFDAL